MPSKIHFDKTSQSPQRDRRTLQLIEKRWPGDPGSDGGTLPPGTAPCLLVKQVGSDWEALTVTAPSTICVNNISGVPTIQAVAVPDPTKDYLWVYDSASGLCKWIETTTTFTCPE